MVVCWCVSVDGVSVGVGGDVGGGVVGGGVGGVGVNSFRTPPTVLGTKRFHFFISPQKLEGQWGSERELFGGGRGGGGVSVAAVAEWRRWWRWCDRDGGVMVVVVA